MKVRHWRAEPARRRLRHMAMWSTLPVRLLLVLAVTPVLTACDASGDSADVSATTPAVTSPAKHDQPCRVTLTQHNSIQVAELHGPPHELSFAGRGPIAVDITGDCPRDLRVAPAVSPGRNINLGESTDQVASQMRCKSAGVGSLLWARLGDGSGVFEMVGVGRGCWVELGGWLE